MPATLEQVASRPLATLIREQHLRCNQLEGENCTVAVWLRNESGTQFDAGTTYSVKALFKKRAHLAEIDADGYTTGREIFGVPLWLLQFPSMHLQMCIRERHAQIMEIRGKANQRQQRLTRMVGHG